MNIHDLLAKAVGKQVVCSLTGRDVAGYLEIEMEGNLDFMFYSAWRIEQEGVVLTTDCDDEAPHIGHRILSVRKLIGSRLLSYQLSRHYDLTLCFDKGFVFKAFCNIGFEQEFEYDYPEPNWTFAVFSLDVVAIVTTCFQVVYTKCYSDEFIRDSDS